MLGDVNSAPAGGSIFGNVLLTNTGSGEDTWTITTVGKDCGIDANMTLGPNLVSEPIGWACNLADDAPAGQQAITFRAVSSMRSNIIVEQSLIYQVEPTWPSNTLVAVTLGTSSPSLSMDSSTSVVITVQNLGNADITGQLNLIGENLGVIVTEWVRLSDQTSTSEYTLTSGSSVDFELTMTSNVARAASATLTVRATSSGNGILTSDESVPMMVTVEGPALPPNGLVLPFGAELDQTTSFALIGAGWGLALIALALIRRRPEVASVDEEDGEEDDEEAEEEEHGELGYNECRLDGESKVNCPTCDARLGVPRGSTPPFRFTCPKCENKIRVIE